MVDDQARHVALAGYLIDSELYRARKRTVWRGRRAGDEAPVLIKTLAEDYPAPADIAALKREHDSRATSRVKWMSYPAPGFPGDPWCPWCLGGD